MIAMCHKSESVQRDIASYEQEQSFLRYITSLSTGAILIIVVYVEKLYPDPVYSYLIIWSLIAFIISIITSVIWYYLSFNDFDSDQNHDQSSWLSNILLLIPFGSVIGFITGVITLSVYAIMNNIH